MTSPCLLSHGPGGDRVRCNLEALEIGRGSIQEVQAVNIIGVPEGLEEAIAWSLEWFTQRHSSHGELRCGRCR